MYYLADIRDKDTDVSQEVLIEGHGDGDNIKIWLNGRNGDINQPDVIISMAFGKACVWVRQTEASLWCNLTSFEP